MMKNALLQYKINKMQKQNDYSIMSSASGAIKYLLVVYDGQNKLIKELYLKLSSYTQLLVWVNTQKDQNQLYCFLQTLKDVSVEFYSSDKYGKLNSLKSKCIVLYPDEGNTEFRKWVRDQFIMLKNPNQQITITEVCDQGFNSYLANILEEQKLINNIRKKTINEKCWFLLDAGNILADDDFILIGLNQYLEIRKKISQSFPENPPTTLNNKVDNFLSQMFQDTLIRSTSKKKIIPVGNLNTNVCDTAKNINSFGPMQGVFNPYLWRNTASNQKKKSIPDKGEIIPELIHIDLFLSLTGQYYDNRYIIIIATPIALFPKNSKVANTLQCLLTNIAIELETKHNFKVLRNPIPLISEHQDDANYYAGFYNNCLVENSDQKRTVFIPSYATGQWKSKLEYFDRINYQIWDRLGFEVKLIKADFHKASNEKGALHCLTHELLRN